MSQRFHVETIDCDYMHPRFASAYLIEADGEAAFIETNTSHSVPRLLKAAESRGVEPGDIRYVIVTHAHLDHAGGAGKLMAALPKATLLAHPRAARHLIDPAKLVAGATAVYGKDRFYSLYGEIVPIPADRVQTVEDEEAVAFGRGRLRFLHTLGHAKHHLCVSEESSGVVFTGDAFGLCYPELQNQGLFIFPSTSPTDFAPVAAMESVARLKNLQARIAYLTHFGQISDIAAGADQLMIHLSAMRDLLESARSLPDRASAERFCLMEIQKYYEAFLSRRGITYSKSQWDLLALDFELNAQGVAWVAHPPPRKEKSHE